MEIQGTLKNILGTIILVNRTDEQMDVRKSRQLELPGFYKQKIYKTEIIPTILDVK